MHAAVVTSVGLVVDAVIVERCLDENELVYGMPSTTPPHLSDIDYQHSIAQSTSSSKVPQFSLFSSTSLPVESTNMTLIKSYPALQSVINDNVHYECYAIKRPLPQRIFHLFDVLPFGMEIPSVVFGVIGRHTNRGLIVAVTPNGLFVVRPYCVGAPLQLVSYGPNRKTVRSEEIEKISAMSSSLCVRERRVDFMEVANRWIEHLKKIPSRDDENKSFYQDHVNDTDDGVCEDNAKLMEGMELWSLKDLQLPPQLALHDPVAPLRVGSRVLARRFGCDGTLYFARVCAVQYEVTYTLQYESDQGIDRRVLHNDIHLLDDSEAEHCSVRDRVTVALHKQLPAVIIECLGGEEYRVILENNPNGALTVSRRHIVFITPLLKDALYADPLILQWFRDLDPTCSGLVPWKDVRHLILNLESFGKNISFQKIGELQRDLCIRVGRLEPQLLRKVPLQEEEMLLGYAEFEYVILRVKNLLMAFTLASQIAGRCASQFLEGINAQLCVLSVGFDIEGIASHIIRYVLDSSLSIHSCVSCIILPDGTKSGTFSRVAMAFQSSLNKNDERVQVHVAEEGTSTRTRCLYYQNGGVVVLSSRTLCADLLHKRISRELVGIAIVLLPYGGPKRSDSVVPSIAFCAEILLRGGGAAQRLSRRRHPPFVLLSDNPCFVRYLLQRRRIGQEPFLSRVHVDDVQLFPRFRLDVVRHFEKLTLERPLTVERVAVGASLSVVALGRLLCQVIKEVVVELQVLESSLSQSSKCSRNDDNNKNDDNIDDDSFLCIQPTTQRTRLEKQPPRYVRKPWVVPSDPRVIRFGCIREEDAVDVSDSTLDDDLWTALRAHEPSWPFVKLVESLLDVRLLLRDLRRLSPFAWLFALESALTSRTSRYQRDGTLTTPLVNKAPDAPWTLSRHFGSIVALAIQRVCVVQTGSVNNTTTNKSSNSQSESSNAVTHVLVEDMEISDDDNDVVCVEPAAPQRLLLPCSDEVDPCMEYANRVVQGWCRDIRRRWRSGDGDGATEPVFLLIVFGERALRRYVCRLAHSLEEFQVFELNGFVASYQAKHGADIRQRVETPITEKSTSSSLRTWFITNNDDDIVEEEEERRRDFDGDVDDGEKRDGARTTTLKTDAFSQEPSFLFSQQGCIHSGNNNNKSAKGGCEVGSTSLHQLLLSQSPLVPPSQPRKKDADCSVSPLNIECVGNGIALLSAPSLDCLSPAPRLRVAVVDGAPLCATDLIMMLKGVHGAFSVPRRVLVVEQQLRFLRLLEMAQDALPPQPLRELRVQVLVEKLEDLPTCDRAVAEEREAFEALAHAKATLTGSLLTDRDTLREVEAQLDSGLVQDKRSGKPQRFVSGIRRCVTSVVDSVAECGATVEASSPLVVFDEREFRSLLPYALYCRGIELVPLTLATADYVLSPLYALERKSVPDFMKSLFSGRIYTQLAALSRRYEHPMCLIEFDRGAPFRLSFAPTISASSLSSGPAVVAGGNENGSLFSRIARLFAAFPRVHFLWSRDATQSAGIIHEMKRTCASESVDPSTPSLTRGNLDLHDVAVEKEAAHLAARVLSCFPGVTESNAPKIMAVCGSLAGLATIDEATLVVEMGEVKAKQLYSFLHDDLVTKVV